MKVLHLWKGTTDQAGGGGLLMGQLHRELRAQQVDSRLMVEFLAPGENGSEAAILPRWRVDGLLHRMLRPLGLNDIHRMSTVALLRHPFFREADVVHLHGTHSGYLNYLMLPLLAQFKPLAMTLHDIWATTGHCAVSFDCERWRSGCGRCPYPGANPPIERDATAVEWRLKRWAFQTSGLTLVAVSEALRKQAQESLLAGLPLRFIANGVDTEVFVPQDKAEVRARLGLPQDKAILLFSARELMDWGKGWDLLAKALAALDADLRGRIEVAALGRGGKRLAEALPVPTHNLGFRAQEQERALIYAAADILVMPSRAEALSLTTIEAMASARPQVAFNTGGAQQLIHHRHSGYIAAYEDVRDLARGIAWAFAEPGRLEAAGREARALAQRSFSLQAMTDSYLRLYEELAGRLPAAAGSPAPSGLGEAR